MLVGWISRAVPLLVLLHCSVISSSAQIDRGTIQGVVRDQTGGVIPGAKVQIIRIDTNSAIDLATNEEGLYTAPNLTVGDYRIVVEQGGFTTIRRERIEVRAGVQVRVDVTLQPGGVTESVNVTEDAPLLDVSTTSNATALQSQLIHDLPLIVTGTKRDITGFLQNLPGYTGGGTFSARANGALAGDTEVFVDGGAASEWGIQRGALAEVGPFIEMVGEFSVVSNSFNAEYGGFGIWFTNVNIKSGTNELHGSIFDHFGNDRLNARSFFQPKKSKFRQNEGGFTVGGPLVLPKIYNGRNKTFFFGSLGLFYSRAGQGGSLITVPTQDFVRGDFSSFVNAAGVQIPIFDPATTRPDGRGGFMRDQFPGNIIPPERISPVSRKITQYLPNPDLPGINNNFYDHKAPTWPFFNTYSPLVKVDHSVSTRQKISVLYTNQIRHRLLWGNPGSGLGPQPNWGEPQTNPLDWVTDQIANSWKVRINHDYVFSPALLNHITVSADRYLNRGANKTAGQGWDQKLGILGIPADNGVFPQISFTGGNGVPVNFGRGYDEDWREMRYTFDENLTWIRGKHTMKFGFEVATNAINRLNRGDGSAKNPSTGGNLVFSNLMTSQPNAGANFASWGSAFASFLLGEVSSASALIPIETGLRFRRYAAFAQDEWHVSPSLTLSYGLRWDYGPPYREVHNYMTSFQPDLPNPDAGGRLGALAYAGSGPGRLSQFQDSWRLGFGPRLGVAYQLNSKTLLRASGGIYYTSSANNSAASSLGYSGTASFSSPDGYTPLYNWTTQSFPQNFKRPPVVDPSFLNGQAITYIPRSGDRLPQILSWTFGVQREVARNLSLDVSYVGSHSTHLAMGTSASQLNVVPLSYLSLGSLLLQPINSSAAIAAGYTEPFPGFSSQTGANTVAQALKPYPQYTAVNMDSARLPAGVARYHSLQVKSTKRFSNGLTSVVFVTWMKNLSNVFGGNTLFADDAGIQYPPARTVVMDPGISPVTFGASWGYELPFGKNKRFFNSASPVVSRIVSGWEINGSVRYATGTALQITANNNLGALGYPAKLADYVGGQPVFLKSNPRDFDPAKDRYLNSAAFAVPATFSLGNTARYLDWARGWTQKSEALSVGKKTQLNEGTLLEISADFTNPFNFVRWSNPNTNITSAAFGTVTGTAPGRTAQLNATLKF